jgi:large subunit ribosomal protein L22
VTVNIKKYSYVENFAGGATLASLKGSPQKINLVLKHIRGVEVSKAIELLSGMRKDSAEPIRKLVSSAVANVEQKETVEKGCLFIGIADVGKSMILKRTDIKGRSRMGYISKIYSRVSIVLVKKGGV